MLCSSYYEGGDPFFGEGNKYRHKSDRVIGSKVTGLMGKLLKGRKPNKGILQILKWKKGSEVWNCDVKVGLHSCDNFLSTFFVGLSVWVISDGRRVKIYHICIIDASPPSPVYLSETTRTNVWQIWKAAMAIGNLDIFEYLTFYGHMSYWQTLK